MSSINVSFAMPKKGADVRGRLSFPILQVLAGSVIAEPETHSMPAPYRTLRRQLVEQGIIARRNSKLIFTQSYFFDNASEAVCVVGGGSMDGYRTWIDEDGHTLHDMGYSR